LSAPLRPVARNNPGDLSCRQKRYEVAADALCRALAAQSDHAVANRKLAFAEWKPTLERARAWLRQVSAGPR
jgi:hypothetical protein